MKPTDHTPLFPQARTSAPATQANRLKSPASIANRGPLAARPTPMPRATMPGHTTPPPPPPSTLRADLDDARAKIRQLDVLVADLRSQNQHLRARRDSSEDMPFEAPAVDARAPTDRQRVYAAIGSLALASLLGVVTAEPFVGPIAFLGTFAAVLLAAWIDRANRS